MSNWSAKNPYNSKLTNNYVLNGEGSRKETRHLVFDLGDSGLEYKAGDALGIIPTCPLDMVEELLSIGGFTGEEEIETHLGPCELRDALTYRYEIHRVSKKWLVGLGSRVASGNGGISISIVKRVRTSTVDGSSILSWDGSGDGEDVPAGYTEICSPNDYAEELWNNLTSDSKEMEDYMWTRDYLDALGDFGHIGFTHKSLLRA